MSTVQKVMDAVIVTGTYTNQAGENKKEYLTVGALFVYNEGGFSLKIKDGISVSGNIGFYDRKPKGQQSQYAAPAQQQQDRSYPPQGYAAPQAQPQHNQQGTTPQFDADGNQVPFSPLKIV